MMRRTGAPANSRRAVRERRTLACSEARSDSRWSEGVRRGGERAPPAVRRAHSPAARRLYAARDACSVAASARTLRAMRSEAMIRCHCTCTSWSPGRAETGTRWIGVKLSARPSLRLQYIPFPIRGAEDRDAQRAQVLLLVEHITYEYNTVRVPKLDRWDGMEQDGTGRMGRDGAAKAGDERTFSERAVQQSQMFEGFRTNIRNNKKSER